MPGIAHKNLTDPQLHEIKGASTATLNQVPIADGEGHAPFGGLTPEQLAFTPGVVDVLDPTTITVPAEFSTATMSAETDGNIADGINFTQTNKNLKELAVKLNAALQTIQTVKAAYLDLVAKHNELVTALQDTHFIQGTEETI